MEIIHTALANVAVGVFSGADSVDGVDKPFPTCSHLKNKITILFPFSMFQCNA